MFKAWLVLVLMLVAGGAQAQRVVKCTQADGSVVYQQTACAGGAAESTVKPPPPPPTPTRSMVQAFDPETGVPTNAWMDGPAPPSGAFYITREFRTVTDPVTGEQRQALVDVRHPVPSPQSRPRELRNRRLQFSPEGRYYSPDARERAGNSTYEKARCRVAAC